MAPRHTHRYDPLCHVSKQQSLLKPTRPGWVDTSTDGEPGIPHQLDKDDVWNGYFIPKGAYIHAVEWFVALMIN